MVTYDRDDHNCVLELSAQNNIFIALAAERWCFCKILKKFEPDLESATASFSRLLHLLVWNTTQPLTTLFLKRLSFYVDWFCTCLPWFLFDFVSKGSTSVKGYFPDDTWYDGTDGSILQTSGGGGQYHTLQAPWNKINFHYRGGHVIVTQQPNITTYQR